MLRSPRAWSRIWRRRRRPTPDAMAAVRPIDPARLRAPQPDARSAIVADLLNRSLRHQLKTWWPDQLGASADVGWTPRFDPANAEPVIRPIASVALGVASAVATGGYRPGVVTVDDAAARRAAATMVDGVARTHIAAAGQGGWGLSWQSPLWAAYGGLAAWLLWADLDPATRRRVVAMIVTEADRLLSWPVPHYRAPDGSVVTPGDSKAEELSWTARVLHLSVAMMPSHPRRSAWRDASIPMLVAAYTAPQDLHDGRVVHGRPVCAWVGGSNVEEDGTVTNHGRTHPSYMSFVHHGAAAIHALLAAQPVDEATLLNLDRLYATLVDRYFPSPPNHQPGGTIYRTDTPDLYFPQGNDWRHNGRVGALVLDVEADLWGLDRLASRPASGFADLHAAGCKQMMDRFEGGRLYAGADEHVSPNREQEAVERFAQGWLAIVATANGRLDVSSAPAGDPVNVTPVCGAT